jgi:DNA polymerase III subunit delta'
MDRYINEMVELYNQKKFPKVLLLNGKKGIGKFTLVVHFLNYIFTKNEKNPYNIKDKIINTESVFYNQLLNQTNQDILFLKAEENKNIKIEDIRNLKFLLSRSSLSNNPRFVIIDEVEFLNENSVNALLKPLEEPTDNNFFILINSQQANLLQTVSSRCLKNNIFLTIEETNNVIAYLLENNDIENLFGLSSNLTAGLFIQFNEICSKFSLTKNDTTITKVKKLLNAYKKERNKILINLTLFIIDQHFIELIKLNGKKIDFLMNIKSHINKNINDFIHYNLNINSVLNLIEVKLKDV